MIAFSAPVIQPKQSYRSLKGGGGYQPARVVKAAKVLRAAAEAAMRGREPLEGALGLTAVFAYGFPKSWPKKKRQLGALKTTRPDGDNLLKLVKDAMNGVVYLDDSQVAIEVALRLYHDAEDETLILVQEIE